MDYIALSCFSFMELSTRRVEIAGMARRANGLWMTQITRNLTDGVEGFFKGKRYLIHDKDPLYTWEFSSILAEVGIESVKLPPLSPSLCFRLRLSIPGHSPSASPTHQSCGTAMATARGRETVANQIGCPP